MFQCDYNDEHYCFALRRIQFTIQYLIIENPPSKDADKLSSAVGNVWEYLTQKWKMEMPKLIISVTGGAKRFEMKKRHLQSFKRGLMKAATSSGEFWFQISPINKTNHYITFTLHCLYLTV